MAESSHPNQPRRSGRLAGRFARLVRTAILAVAVLSCDTPGIRLVDPETVSDNSTGVTFHVTLEDSALAAALGWEGGVPNALISYYRIMEGTPIQTTETDSVGNLHLSALLPSQYRFAAYRMLREEETGPTGGQTRAFGDGLIVHVQPPQAVDLTLRADHRGSVVISEMRREARYEGPAAGWPDYDYFGYFELYNNSDTVVYLDGMLWGRGFQLNNDGANPCAVTAPYRNDPRGVWARFFFQFPGSGTQYVLAPGEVAVVAMDAVDHSVVHPSLPDLTGADFELEGTADADNPDVPNLRDVGPSSMYWETHGMNLGCSDGCFLAHATDVSTLLTERLPVFDGTLDWQLIPVASIIDVVTTDSWNPSMDQWTPCPTKVHRGLDRLEFPESEVYDDVGISMQRNVLRLGTGGFPLLHDVGVSFWDFVVGPRSPGWIEY